MSRLYDPREIYDLRTMPRVEGFAETNNCDFVRFHWVLTEADQKAVDSHWRPDFYRHSLINSKMYLATSAGRGVPGWDPYLGYTEEQAEKRDYETGDGLFENTLAARIAQGRRVEPTGLEDDPRLPPRDPAEPKKDILGLLRGAKERYDTGVGAEHERLLAEHAAQKSGSWAQRASVASKPVPTLEEARKSYEQRQLWRQDGEFERALEVRSWPRYSPPPWPGVWHEWEIVEISREQGRIRAIDEAEARADAYMKSRYPCWGGGT
jgi:hypothetical protein